MWSDVTKPSFKEYWFTFSFCKVVTVSKFMILFNPFEAPAIRCPPSINSMEYIFLELIPCSDVKRSTFLMSFPAKINLYNPSSAANRKTDRRTKDPTNEEFRDETPIKMVFSNIKDAYTWENINNLSEKPKSNAQWAGILLSIVFVLGLLSGIMYGIKWNNQEDQWDNNGLSSVHGSVIDENGNAMEGVAVYGGDKQTTTNNQGQYYLYDLPGEEISILFSIEGYKDVSVWIDIRSGSPNILEIEIEEGNGDVKLDYRKQVAEPWPPNYALAPIFMISALITLMGSAAALLQENFKIAIAGCLFGIISYGFLIGSVLSVVALALLLIDYQKFNNK